MITKRPPTSSTNSTSSNSSFTTSLKSSNKNDQDSQSESSSLSPSDKLSKTTPPPPAVTAVSSSNATTISGSSATLIPQPSVSSVPVSIRANNEVSEEGNEEPGESPLVHTPILPAVLSNSQLPIPSAPPAPSPIVIANFQELQIEGVPNHLVQQYVSHQYGAFSLSSLDSSSSSSSSSSVSSYVPTDTWEIDEKALFEFGSLYPDLFADSSTTLGLPPEPSAPPPVRHNANQTQIIQRIAQARMVEPSSELSNIKKIDAVLELANLLILGIEAGIESLSISEARDLFQLAASLGRWEAYLLLANSYENKKIPDASNPSRVQQYRERAFHQSVKSGRPYVDGWKAQGELALKRLISSRNAFDNGHYGYLGGEYYDHYYKVLQILKAELGSASTPLVEIENKEAFAKHCLLGPDRRAYVFGEQLGGVSEFERVYGELTVAGHLEAKRVLLELMWNRIKKMPSSQRSDAVKKSLDVINSSALGPLDKLRHSVALISGNSGMFDYMPQICQHVGENWLPQASETSAPDDSFASNYRVQIARWRDYSSNTKEKADRYTQQFNGWVDAVRRCTLSTQILPEGNSPEIRLLQLDHRFHPDVNYSEFLTSAATGNDARAIIICAVVLGPYPSVVESVRKLTEFYKNDSKN